MKVLFKNSQGVKREIAEVESVNEGYVEIQKFCTARNYEPHYYRTIERDNVLKVDVGSHSEFFYIVKVEEVKGDVL